MHVLLPNIVASYLRLFFKEILKFKADISSNVWAGELILVLNHSLNWCRLWIPSIGSIDRGGFWSTSDPRGLIKGSEQQQPRLSEDHWEHTIEVWHCEAESWVICVLRGQEKAGKDSVRLWQPSAANASSFHFICPLFFFYQSIPASPPSPPCPLRCPQPLPLTPAPTSAIWFSPRCPLTPALWTDYKWHLNNHFPIPSDRETRQTHRASPSKLLWLKSDFWVLCQTSVIW